MYINAIKFQDGDVEHFVKIKKAKGPLRSTSLVLASEEMLTKFKRALIYGLTGFGAREIQSVIVNFVDPDGHSWVFDRRSAELKVFKDKQRYTEPRFAELVALFGLRGWSDSPEALAQALFGEFNLDQTPAGVMGMACNFSKIPTPNANQVVYERLVQESLGAIRLAVPQLAGLSSGKLKSLVDSLMPAYYDLEGVSRQAEALKKLKAAISHEECLDTEHMEAQIELIERIEVVASELFRPNAELEQKIADYRGLDKQLTALCAQYSIPSVSLLEKPVDWNQALKIMARLSLYEQLVRSSELALQKAKQSVEPTLKAYTDTVEIFLSNDQQITSELQNCLGIITGQVNQAANTKVRPFRFGPFRAFQRLKKSTTPPQNLPQVAGGQDKSGLDKSRMAVDYALGRLGELHANLKSNNKCYEAALQPLYERHEKLVQDYGRLKYTWRELAKQHNFPKKCTVRDILGMIQNQSEILKVYSSKQKLKAEIQSYNLRVQELIKLVEAWRQHTKSGKETPLTNLGLLLAETRGILEYGTKRKNQLSKTKKMQVEHLTHRKLDQLLTTRSTMVQNAWAEAFTSRHLPILDHQGIDWPDVFRKAHLIEGIATMRRSEEAWVTLSQLLSEDGVPQPIRMFNFGSDTTPMSMAHAVSEALRDNYMSREQIFLVAQEDLAAALEKQGFETARIVTKPRAVEARVGASAKPELATKAQRAMEIFQSQPTKR